VKNMNSFRSVENAIAYEIERQAAALAHGEPLRQETRLWDAEREETRPMRSKEFAHDYRLLPRARSPAAGGRPEWVDEVRATLPSYLPPGASASSVTTSSRPTTPTC